MGLVDKPPVAAAASSMEPATGRPFYGFIPGASTDDSGHESIIPMTDEANWDDLPRELMSKVAENLLRSDVTDYIQLRDIKPWRGAAPRLVGLNPRFFPRHWKMLQIQGEEARFVNALTGASLRVEIPQQYGRFLACAEGCLLFASPSGRGTQKLHLCNPVTRAVAGLPTLLTTFISQDFKAAGIIYDLDDGEAPTPTVVLLVAVWSIDMVLYARPGDALWQWRFFAPYEDGELPLLEGEGGLSLGGSFYVPTRTGHVVKLELQPQPHFVYAARQQATQASHFLHLRSYLVPSVDAGMLLVVRRFESQAGYVVAVCHVFQVNLREGTLILLQDQKDIGNRSIFHRWLTLGTQ